MRRGPRARARRQRAASHISAIESGPPDTARTIAGAAFQSANRRLTSCAEIGELSSSDMASPAVVEACLSAAVIQAQCHPRACTAMHYLGSIDAALALNPLLLTVHSRFDAAGGAGIFPRHLAERRAGGLLLFQGRQRLSQPQQCVRAFRRFIEFGGHREEGFRGVAIALALEKALAEPVLGVRQQGIAGVFLREVAHGLFGERIVLALHIADAEIEFVLRNCRRRQGGKRAGGVGIARRRWRQWGRRIARAAGVCQIERLPCAASARSADGCLGRDRELTAAKRLRRARGIRIPGGIEGVTTTPALHLRNSRWGCLWFLDDRCRSGNLLVVTRLGLWLPERRIRLYRRRRGGAGLSDGRVSARGRVA